MKETFGTTNTPLPYPFYQLYPLNPNPNTPGDPAEPEIDVKEEDEYTASVKVSQEKHKKFEDTDVLTSPIPNPITATLHT